ncbi:MAG: hypothetical protein GEU90_08810 [Gemmatimonas sp.]|nr:hypothetical protein [Gemmatimonas sp.]
MEINSIRRQKRRTDRLNLYVDGEFRLTIAAEVAVRRGLRPGHALDEAELTALAEEDARWRARESALRLLSYRQRSENEIRRRLASRHFDPATVETCIDHLKAASLLDDEAFAIAFCRDRLRSRPSGRARLAVELRAKGVRDDVAREALDQIFSSEGQDELELARQAAHKFTRPRNIDALRLRRRLYGFLSRRGFSADTIAAVMEESAPAS